MSSSCDYAIVKIMAMVGVAFKMYRLRWICFGFISSYFALMWVNDVGYSDCRKCIVLAYANLMVGGMTWVARV